MLKSLSCDFLTGPLTDEGSLEVLKHSLEQQSAGCHEVLYYKKNGTGIWMEVSTILCITSCVLYTYNSCILSFAPFWLQGIVPRVAA